jgi:hypothetical protein
MEYNMKTMLMMAGLALLLGTTTLAAAGEQGCCRTTSVEVTRGNDKTDKQLGCNPSVGNWQNDARQTCPMRGSGPGLFTTTREITICRDIKEYTGS